MKGVVLEGHILGVAGSLWGSIAAAVGRGSPWGHVADWVELWQTLWPSALSPGLQTTGFLPCWSRGECRLTGTTFPWVCRDLRLSYQSWGGTMAVGARGRGGPFHDSVAFHFGFLGAQDQAHGQHLVIPPACE